MNKIQSLNGIWSLQKGNDTAGRIPTAMPGTVLSAILKHGAIEDPSWRCNEYRTWEFTASDFTYDREFTVEPLDCDSVTLVCEGLDTLVTVTVNGVEIARTDDMHRTCRIEVKKLLRAGMNHISIRFDSALVAARKEDAENDIFYAPTGCIHGNAVIQKAHYTFGWNRGSQLSDAGIFRNVPLEYRSLPKFMDVLIRQEHDGDGSVALKLYTGVDFLVEKRDLPVLMYPKSKRIETELSLAITIEDLDGNCMVEIYPFQREISTEVPNPRLWWPNGVGEHPLYQMSMELKTGDGVICDICRRRIELRTIDVCMDAHEYGSEFASVVNGVKISAMGANHIPEDIFLNWVTKERTCRLVKDCESASHNCIRVWGGSYYPGDYFYDVRDEAGIMVWRDLMFTCSVYALMEHLEENIVEETKDNARRLRHHPCLALWCGNNEMGWGWGDEWARIKGHHPRYKADYIKIFEYVLLKALKNCDDVAFYWPSPPPSSGSLDDLNAVNRSNQHYWEAQHSGKPLTEYRKEYFSFCLEYGLQSFPGMKTIESFTLLEDRNIFSQVMEPHQKNGSANGKILDYVADYFSHPKSLGDLVYISQVLQLKAIQYGVEHWRRNRGCCMGSLYWQINGCWPVASQAGIDYFGRWKALRYGAKRFYTPVMASVCEKEELLLEIGYFVNNDTLEPAQGRVEATLIDQDFQVLRERTEDITVEPTSVGQSFSVDYRSVTPKRMEEWKEEQQVEHYAKQQETWSEEKPCSFAGVRLYIGDTPVLEQVTLLVKPKHLQYREPEYVIAVTETEEQFIIRMRSSSLAQYVELEPEELDGVFSNNYFDITTPEGVEVSLSKTESPEGCMLENLERQIWVRSVADSYEVG